MRNTVLMFDGGAIVLSSGGKTVQTEAAIIAVSFLVGLVAGFHASSRLRRVLIVSAVMSLCFWAFVPDGWWVHPPPGQP